MSEPASETPKPLLEPTGGAHRLVLRMYVIMLVAIACVVGVIVFGRSRRDPQPYRGSSPAYIVDTVAPHRDDPKALATELARVERLTPYEVTLYGAGGHLLGSTSARPPAPLTPAQVKALPPGLLEGAEISSPPGFPRDQTFRLSADGEHAIVRFLGTRPQRPDFRFDLTLVLISLGVASVVLARMIARPLARIAQAARRFGAGDLAARSRLDRRDELGELSHTFDEMADRLTQLLRAQRELLASVSHELKTPLSRIRVALDLAAEGDAEAARESLRDITEDLAELEELVNDVLAMARLDAHVVGPRAIPPLRRDRIDAAALMRKAATRFTTAHPERPLELTAEAEPLAIEADPNLLRRVVENLLENAHKYSAAGAAIHLSLARRTGDATFAVSDRGQGVGAEDLPFVFEPFFRADRSRTRGTGGIGLGLALSKRVVEAHGGRIRMESQLGAGTTVTFTVPLADASLAGSNLS